MKLTWVTRDGKRTTLPAPREDQRSIDTGVPCGVIVLRRDEPDDAKGSPCRETLVHGTGRRIKGDDPSDTYESDARCCNCGSPRGRLEAKLNTLFGLREDEAVLCSGYVVL